MAKIKISANQFLGEHEYNRMLKFQSELGLQRNVLLNSSKFGFYSDFKLTDLGTILKEDCFYARKAGSPASDIIIQKGAAMASDGNLLINKEELSLTVPSDNNWYWVKASHKFSSIETGKVSIDAFGNLTGIGTNFLEVLRGQPKFPTKIKFSNSLNQNVYEYEVVKVIDSANCVLFGDFNAESNLSYSVVGTFSAGAIIPEISKGIYQFDGSDITLSLETTLETPPSYTMGREFYIARVKNTGIDVVLQDKRIDWYKDDSLDMVSTVNRGFDNPLIGVEAVKYDITTSTKDKNIIELAHGFRFSSYTIDTSSKKITILSGTGGVYKNTSMFQAGDFDQWRLYLKDGSFFTVIDSQKAGSQIVLTLDVLLTEIMGVSDKLFVCPPYENIEIKSILPGTPNSEKISTFPANTEICRFNLNALSECVSYNLIYRYKNNANYTAWKIFPDDSVGNYKETSFYDNGDLKSEGDRISEPYVADLIAGFIKVCENSQSYDKFKSLISTGDNFGVNTTEFSNATPRIDLQVSKDKSYQHFKSFGVDDLDLGSNLFINLKKFKDDANTIPCREGNSFTIHVTQRINLSSFRIRIVEDFIDPTNFTKVCEITSNETAYIKNNSTVDIDSAKFQQGLLITCTFDDNGKWIAHFDTDTTSKGTVKMQVDVSSQSFDINGEGVLPGFFGWKIMEEMLDAFPMGTNLAASVGETGGANMKELVLANIPAHTHETNYGAADANATGSSKTWLQSSSGTAIKISSETGGETDGSTRPFDNRPNFYKFLFIKKIV